MPLYLAMTAAEISVCNTMPEKPAYMACHFSPYGAGLSNLPKALPEGSMIILNDRIPLSGHDPGLVAEQLCELCTKWKAESILLDLQRTDSHMPTVIREILSCANLPVGVSELYAKALDCPVFINAPPMHVPPQNCYAAWKGRELWLEVALEQLSYLVTEQDCQRRDLQTPASLPCPELYCHYGFHREPEHLVISLKRSWQDLQALMSDSPITKAIGLYQQLGKQRRLSPLETAAAYQNLPPPPP